MSIALVCWRCEKAGHVAAECTPPPASTETEVRQRIQHYMDLRIAGRISLTRKREWVKQEWKAFHDMKAKAREAA